MLLRILCNHMHKNFSKRTFPPFSLFSSFSTFYTKNHEWIKIEDKKGTIGITEHAQEQLGDIIYAEFEDNITLDKGDVLGNLESVKATSDVFAPVDCRVLEVNDEIHDNPEIINKEAQKNGWIVKVEILNDNKDELLDNGELLDKDGYEEFIG